MRGNVSSEAQKDLTTEYVKDVEGVKIVINKIKTLSVAMKPGSKNLEEKMNSIGKVIDDASVTALVKSTLLYHRSTCALKTTVKIKDGVITLRERPKPICLGLTIIIKRRINYVRHNISHNSDTGALGNDPVLATQPILGVWTQWRSWHYSTYHSRPAPNGQTLIRSSQSVVFP